MLRLSQNLHTGRPLGPKVYIDAQKEGLGPTFDKLLAGSTTYFPDNEPRRCQIYVWYHHVPSNESAADVSSAAKRAVEAAAPQSRPLAANHAMTPPNSHG